jgi:uncharacterized protein YprB with RNaseH-like and TPR domain
MNRPDPLSETLRRRLSGWIDRGIVPAADPCCSRFDWLGDGEIIRNRSGEHYRLSLPLADFWHPPRRPRMSAASGVESIGGRRIPVHPELDALTENFPEAAVFLDLETCGLAGAAIFLVGLVRLLGQSLRLELLLARNYSEERAMLESLWDALKGCRVLVTFNGKSFDWPMVCDRSIRHRLPTALAPAGRSRRAAPEFHCDLLHHARRLWRGRLPNCRLQTLEWHVCGRRRSGDIPGSLIPEAYRAFVRTGDARDMSRIMHHNTLDLVTLVELAMRMTRLIIPPT